MDPRCMQVEGDVYCVDGENFWLCAVCGNLNLENRTHCNMKVCAAPRLHPGPFRIPPVGIRLPDPQHRYKGEWTCPHCAKLNAKRSAITCVSKGCPGIRPGAILTGTPIPAPDNKLSAAVPVGELTPQNEISFIDAPQSQNLVHVVEPTFFPVPTAAASNIQAGGAPSNAIDARLNRSESMLSDPNSPWGPQSRVSQGMTSSQPTPQSGVASMVNMSLSNQSPLIIPQPQAVQQVQQLQPMQTIPPQQQQQMIAPDGRTYIIAPNGMALATAPQPQQQQQLPPTPPLHPTAHPQPTPSVYITQQPNIMLQPTPQQQQQQQQQQQWFGR